MIDSDSGWTMVAVVAVVVVAAAVAVVPKTLPAEPSVQASNLDMNGDTATVDGSISTFTVSVSGTAEWSDLPSPARRVDVTVMVEDKPQQGDAGETVVAERSLGASGTDGQRQFSASGDVLGNTNWAASDFAPSDGENVTRELAVVVVVDVVWSEDPLRQKAANARDTMTITVSNPTETPTANPVVTITASGSATVE